MIEVFLQGVLQSTGLLQTFIPEYKIRTTLAEFRNKLQAFYLFQHISSVLNLPATNLCLAEMLERAASLGPFFSVWATEGLGHYHTSKHFIRSFPESLLSDSRADLPRTSLIPLHAGMGLALAEASLKHGSNSRNLADHFLDLCHKNAREGYLGAAIESLGVAVRNLRPDLVASLDREFAQRDEGLLEYFWHGVGRGIYFTPANSLLWMAPWQGYQMCLQEPPHLLGQINALAGFAWALTLVNIQAPQVLAAFFKHHQENLWHENAFKNGIFSAFVIWLESAPGDLSIQTLRSFRPETSGTLAAIWDRCVKQPCENALERHPRLQSEGSLGDLFRYRSLLAPNVSGWT
jgi:hypothetical protein